MSSKSGFSAEAAALWLSRNSRALLFAGALLLFGGLGFIFLKDRWDKQAEQIRSGLYDRKSALQSLVNKEEAKKEKPKSGKQKIDFLKSAGKDPLPFTEEIRLQAKSYEDKIRRHSKNIAAAAFAMDLADFYYLRSLKAEAKSLLSLFALPGKKSALYHLASLQQAGYYMDSGECKKALTLLEGLRKNKKAAAFHLESRLQQALCMEQMKDYEGALKAYTEAAQEDAQGYTGLLAQDYKRLLILKRRLEEAKKEK